MPRRGNELVKANTTTGSQAFTHTGHLNVDDQRVYSLTYVEEGPSEDGTSPMAESERLPAVPINAGTFCGP